MVFSLLLVFTINTVSSTDCFDESECYGSTITDEALCYGYRACYSADINGTSAECSGKYGCGSASITTNGSVECSGDVSCIFATISSENDIECEGKSGCLFATMKADDNVDCDGYLSCGSSHITAADGYVSSYGRSGLFAGNVSAEHVLGYGYFALALSTLDSRDLEDMSVSCYGNSGGYLAEFICRSGSECDLFCQGNCCGDMDYVCLSGSTCSVSCDEENGDECPAQNISLSLQDDDEISRYLENKRIMKKHDEKYIETMKELKKTENNYNAAVRDIKSGSLLSWFGGSFMVSNESFINSSILISSLITFIITFAIVYCWFSIKYKDNEYKPLLDN